MHFWGLFHVLLLVSLDSLTLLFCRSRRHSDEALRQKVLIIRLDAIGDFILWLNSARALRKLYPKEQYELTLLGNSLWASLAADLGLFDVVWPLERKRFVQNLFYRINFILKVRRTGFDQVVHPVVSRELCQGDSLVRATGALNRIGARGDTTNTSLLAKKISDGWYTSLLPAGAGEMSELRRHAEFVRGLGYADFEPSLPCLDIQPVGPKGFTLDKYYVVVPGAGHPYRQWPLENFAQIAQSVYDLTGMTAVVCGDASEAVLGERLVKAQPDLFHDWVGKTSLLELVAIIKNADFVLSNETSAAHIAAAVGVRSVCILGGGHFGRFLPYAVDDEVAKPVPIPVYMPMDCFNCNWDCRFNVPAGAPVPCIENVQVDAVWSTVEHVLSQQQ